MPAARNKAKEEAFRLFEEAVSALIGSNVIVTQKPISDLLKCLVFSDELHAFVSDCLKGVNYREEYKKASTEEAFGHSFVLPGSNKRIVALVTGLLGDFDTGEKDLHLFLRDHFNANDSISKYKMFCDSVLIPYYEAFRDSFLYDPDQAEESPEEEPNILVPDDILNQVATALTALRTVFQEDNKLSSDKRNDLFFLTDSVYYSLEKGDLRFLKAVWTGLKLTLSDYKKAFKAFSDLTDILALYALL